MSQGELPQGWRAVVLSDICDVNPPISLPEEDIEKVFDFVPMDAVDETTASITYRSQRTLAQVRQGKTRFQIGDVLFAKITPCTENGKVALVERLDSEMGFGSTEFYILRAKDGLLPVYLWFWLRSPATRQAAVDSMTGSSGRQRVPSSFWGNISIPLPPLPVQRAIVAILSKADAVRRKRVEARLLVDKALPALFIDICGDPFSNALKWSTHPLTDFIISSRNGFASGERNVVDGVAQVRMNNILTTGWFNKSAVRRVGRHTNHNSYILSDGDVLFNNTNSPELVGKTTIFREPEDWYFSNYISRLRVNTDIVTPEWLWGLLNLLWRRGVLRGMCRQWVNQAAIPLDELLALSVPIPPHGRLEAHRQAVNKIEQIKTSIEERASVIERLFAVLLPQAFTGELTAEWEREHADLITAEVARLERRPRLALLALVAHRRRRREEPVGITSLMKYAFLAQMQGAAFEQANQRLYQFVPYHYGPFAQELYDDLAALEVEGWLTVARPEGELTTHERIDITLNPARAAELPAALADLSDAERAALAAVIERYGDLSHNDLLAAVYEAYPEYARKSRLRRKK
jgi:type I restriction enzyme S subunit